MNKRVVSFVILLVVIIVCLCGCRDEKAVETVAPTELVQSAAGFYKVTLTDDEIDLISVITMAEADGESIKGKRLVIDTILNRVDADGFPDTVADVVFQANAFESIWNGRINDCYANDGYRKLVLEEAHSRTNACVLYFNAEGYSDYGTPLFKEGNHYFSGK